MKSREEALEWASRIPGEDEVIIEVRRLFDISDFTGDVQEKLVEFDKADASKLGQ